MESSATVWRGLGVPIFFRSSHVLFIYVHGSESVPEYEENIHRDDPLYMYVISDQRGGELNLCNRERVCTVYVNKGDLILQVVGVISLRTTRLYKRM